jgi:hypothetical protein
MTTGELIFACAFWLVLVTWQLFRLERRLDTLSKHFTNHLDYHIDKNQKELERLVHKEK